MSFVESGSRQHSTSPFTPPPPHAATVARIDGAVTYDSEAYALLNHPLETERHARRVARYLRPGAGDRLLEVGCGRGWLTRRVQERHPTTCGVDVNPSSIAHAVTRNLRRMDATALRFEDASFDHLYSFHTIEHIPDLRGALREMQRVLVPGGRVLLVYPAEPIRGLYAMPGAWLGFGNPLLARRLHVHKLTPRRVTALAAGCGLLHVESAFHLLLTPQFITVLRKPGRSS